MKPAAKKTPDFMQRGFSALSQALGPDGMVTFIQRISPGSGNYTRDRQKWLADASEDEVFAQVRTAALRGMAKERVLTRTPLNG